MEYTHTREPMLDEGQEESFHLVQIKPEPEFNFRIKQLENEISIAN